MKIDLFKTTKSFYFTQSFTCSYQKTVSKKIKTCLNPLKISDIFQQIQEILFWDPFGLFFSKFGQKYGLFQFLNIPIIYHHAKIRKKN